MVMHCGCSLGSRERSQGTFFSEIPNTLKVKNFFQDLAKLPNFVLIERLCLAQQCILNQEKNHHYKHFLRICLKA